MELAEDEISAGRERYDEYNAEDLKFKIPAGLNEEVVREISRKKEEPEWMLKKRLIGLKAFEELKMPSWGPDLSTLDLDKIHFFMMPNAKTNAESWDEVPENIRNTYKKLGIPEAEKNVLAGTGAQYESEVVYHKLKEEWDKKGVIFLDFDEAVKKHPEIVKKYFMNTCVPIRLHKFAALHAAVHSGGTFIYVPKNVKINMPLQAYFRMNARNGGQFEHTLIIVDEGAEVHYIEGCSAPRYNENSLHAGCVEIHVLKIGARTHTILIQKERLFMRTELWSGLTGILDQGLQCFIRVLFFVVQMQGQIILGLHMPEANSIRIPGARFIIWLRIQARQ